jgi:hypothetical protein
MCDLVDWSVVARSPALRGQRVAEAFEFLFSHNTFSCFDFFLQLNLSVYIHRRSEACLTDKKRIFSSVRAPVVSITPSAALSTNADTGTGSNIISTSTSTSNSNSGGVVTASGAGGASSSDDRSLSRVSADSLSQLELMLGAFLLGPSAWADFSVSAREFLRTAKIFAACHVFVPPKGLSPV